MRTASERADAFRALHARNRAFIIPNPWDRGSARMLAHLGFEALATTSAGFAFSRGRPDYGMRRDEVLAHAVDLVAATELPVSADLENGFGDRPEDAAETIRLAVLAGLAGGSIEDSTGRSEHPVYDHGLAADRVRAAAEAAHSGPVKFVLTARAENHLVGRNDLADTIHRLQLFQEAGADVLYAPGVLTPGEIETLVRSVDRPVNVIMGLPGMRLSLSELSALGVRRVSVGSTLARAALGAALDGAREMMERGTFTFGETAAATRDLTAIFDPWRDEGR